MVTISLCMIVKNEARVLARCLDSIADLMDEIIIVDTGSTDETKEIAQRYTDQVYDFEWISDFSAARNFSFSKATMDYIYAPDADEFLDAENHEEFRKLKEALISDVEIVQMKYETISNNTVLNAKTEYRPKLFKRLRTFTWIDPIHETVRLEPVVFDSDITITHMPETLHAKRDFRIFEKMIAEGEILSDKLLLMYATELVKTGGLSNLEHAFPYFETIYNSADSEKHRAYATVILAKYYLLAKDDYKLLTLALKDVAVHPSAEVCYYLGCVYERMKDYNEASLWFTNAAYETQAILDVHLGGDYALSRLKQCYELLVNTVAEEEEKQYFALMLQQTSDDLAAWKLPEE